MPTPDIDRLEFVLPPDIVIVPVDTLAPALRRQIHYEPGDYAISRPRMRRPSKVVGPSTAGLLEEFRRPATILDAVVHYSAVSSVDATDTLEQAFEALQSLIAGDLLVPAASPLAAAVSSSFSPGLHCGEFLIARLVHSLEDTELYEAVSALGVRVALKLLRPEHTTESRMMMACETAIATALHDDCFPTVHSSGSIDGYLFLALQWVDGVPLDTAAARIRCAGPSSRPALRRLCLRVLDAFAKLHEAGYLHGDIHPGNVLVRPDGSVCVLDFGRSGGIHPEHDVETAPRAGLYPFYEPELAAALLRGEMPPPVTPESEQYALAALIYSLVTGSYYRDFSLDSQTLFHQVAHETPLPFAARDIAAWPALETALARALQKDPQQRYPDLRAFQSAIAAVPVPRTPKPSPVSLDSLDYTSPAFNDPARHCPEPDGVIWFLLRAATQQSDSRCLSLADAWAQRHPAPTPITHLLRAFIADARADRTACLQAIAAFLAAAKSQPASWDLLNGRAGELAGAAKLLEIQQHEELDQWVRKTANEMPFGSPIEGLAHGDAGRAYAMLIAGHQPPNLDELAARPLPQNSSWCRGTAGLVYLWAQAKTHDHLGEQAAEFTYRHNDDNPTLCYGLAGRAQALHAWHRHTGQPIWLRRANELARRARTATNFPGPPLSLRKGSLGAALL